MPDLVVARRPRDRLIAASFEPRVPSTPTAAILEKPAPSAHHPSLARFRHFESTDQITGHRSPRSVPRYRSTLCTKIDLRFSSNLQYDVTSSLHEKRNLCSSKIE